MARILGEGNDKVVWVFVIGLSIGILLTSWAFSSKPSTEYPEDVTCYQDFPKGTICY